MDEKRDLHLKICCLAEQFLLPNGRRFAAQQKKICCPIKQHEQPAKYNVQMFVLT